MVGVGRMGVCLGELLRCAGLVGQRVGTDGDLAREVDVGSVLEQDAHHIVVAADNLSTNHRRQSVRGSDVRRHSAECTVSRTNYPLSA